MLYKRNGVVSCVGSDFLYDWALYMIVVPGYQVGLNVIMGRY